MKTTAKIGLLIAAALIVLGIVLFGLVMSVNHWDFTRLSSDACETEIWEIREDFRDIAVRSDTAKVAFVPADGGGCRVEIHAPTSWKRTAEVKNGALTVAVTDERRWYEALNLFNFESPKITVYLPRGEYGALTLENDTGDVSVPADFRFTGIDVSCSTGDVRCAASARDAIRIRLSTGDILLEDLSAGELELTASTGAITLRNVACAGALSQRVSTGKTVLTNVTCAELTSSGSTGDLTMENVLISGKLTVSRSTGDVKLDRCDAAELSIKTETGRVSGSLLSEKVFIVKSDTGKIDVPDTAAGGRCEIATDTGNISITLG